MRTTGRTADRRERGDASDRHPRTAASEARGSSGRGGAAARRLRRGAAGRAGASREAHLEPVPLPRLRPGRRDQRPPARRRRVHPGHPRGPGRQDGRGRRHDHLRGPLRRHPAAQPDAAGRAAAQDDHPRRRGHRPRDRVHLVPQRPAARVGDRDADPHRRRPRRHSHQGQRAQRPVLRLPELLRHPRLLPGADHRARTRQAVRPPAPLRLRRPQELHGGDRRDRGGEELPGPPGRLPRRHRVQHGRAVPDRRRVQRQGALGERLHRPADLLRVGAAEPRGLPQRQGLHLAVGHRLVLVLPRVRRAEQGHQAALAEPGTAARTSTASWSPSTGNTA